MKNWLLGSAIVLVLLTPVGGVEARSQTVKQPKNKGNLPLKTLNLPDPKISSSPLIALDAREIEGRLDSSSGVLEQDNSYYNLYTFDGRVGDRVIIDLKSDEFDAYLLLIDPQGNKISEDDNNGNGRNARIVVTLPFTGTYQVLSNSYSGGQTGNYTLTWREAREAELIGVAVPELDEEDIITVTGRLRRKRSGLFGDIHTFEGQEGQRILIDLESEDFDAFMFLFDPENDFLERNDNGGDGRNARIEIVLPMTGTYYVGVDEKGPDEASGRYTLKWGLVAEAPPPEPRTVRQGRLTTNSNTNREIRRNNSYYNIHTFEGQAGTLIEIEMSSEDFDPYLHLLDPQGNVLEQNDDRNSETKDSRILVTLPVSGTYQILANSYETRQTGSYTLSWGETVPDEPTEYARQREADRFHNEALRQYRAGNFPEAIDLWNRSLAIYRRIGNYRYGDSSALNNMGNKYDSMGEYARAIEAYELSLAMDRETGFLDGQSISLRNLGDVYYAVGEYEKALSSFEEALEINRRTDERDLESTILVDFGYVYLALAEYNKAIDYFERALAIAQKLRHNEDEKSAVFLGLGSVYENLGKYSRAIEFYEQSLTLNRQEKDRRGEGFSLRSLGNVYKTLGEYTKAIDYLKQSLAIYQKLGRRRSESSTLTSLGNVYLSLEEYTQALDYHERSLAIDRETGNRNGEAISSSNLGEIYIARGDTTKAIAYIEQSLAIARTIKNPTRESYGLYNLARAYHKQGKQEQALPHIEAAIAITESIRGKVDNPDLRQSFFAKSSDRYRLYIDILMQLHRQNPERGYDRQALHASEKNRARTLTELLTEANLNIREQVSPQLLAEEQNLLGEFSALEKRRLEILSSSYSNAELERVQGKIDGILKQLADLETRIRRNNPAYADLKYPQPLTLEEIQAQILDTDTLLLEYALGEERSYLFVAGKNSFFSYELPPRAEIEAAVEKYAIALQAEDRNPLAEGKDLAQMLLGPVADKLKGQRLAIVADGKLHRLPFGALPWGNGTNPLLVNHEIVNLSSASSLVIQRQQSANRPRAAKKVAVFADPVFSQRDARLSGDAASVASENSLLELFRAGCQSFDRLPHTRTEAENILSLVPDNQEFLAMGFDADRAAATSEDLAQYQILHLSTHGCIQDNPQLSGLALSLYDEDGKQQDGFLRLQDIYNLKLNADLVVLSACQTGIGEEVSGEGVIGLTRGFMYAGAQRVTVSLWNVSDRATADLMSDYYQNMISEKMKPSAALREAQLQMWREGDYPYKWAAFTMQGDWQ